MRFFKKNKSDDDIESAGQTEQETAEYTSNPTKAKAFFDHAEAAHDATNYEYAMTLWLQGLRQDPTDLGALESFYKSATEFISRNPKVKAPTKDQAQNFGGKGRLEAYLRSLLQWGVRPVDWQPGLKALEHAAALDLNEPGRWIGKRVLAFIVQDKKVKKDTLVKLMEVLVAVGDNERAVRAGDLASAADPSDGRLAARVKNLAAQATIDQSGYSQTGKEGGFRENLRDAEAQRALRESEGIVRSEQTQERVIEDAKTDYEARPTDLGAITKYTRLLLERGDEADEKMAFKVLMEGYKGTKAYRLRERAGDIRMRVARRNLRKLKAAADADPSDTERREKYEKALRDVLEFEAKEYEERIANYPTDLKLKYELGRRYFELEEYDKAIEQFQVAQDAPGVATQVLHALGRSFLALKWLDEAESTFRRALDRHENHDDEVGLSLRYDLMNVLDSRARDNRDVAAAEEAFKLASGIAIKQINFRDIRERREKIQTFLKEVRTESQA